MKNIMNYLLILLGLILVSCEKDDNGPDYPTEEKEIVLSVNSKDMVSSDNQFGIEIFKRMLNADKDKNLMISPLSISQALLMTYNGADGDTKKAFEETLFLNDLTIDEVNQSAQELVKALFEADPGVIIDIANSIWYRDGYTIKPEFIQVNEDYYNAEVQQLVFNDEAVDIINAWVKDKTNDKIEEIIDSIDPMTLMFLINAVYFKGNWKYQFEESNTVNGEFTLSNGSKITVPFMHQSITAKVMGHDDFTILDLLYGRGNFSMFIVLPDKDKTIDDVLESWNNDTYNQWLTDFTEVGELNVVIPKFKFAYEKELNDVLMDMGLTLAFDPDQADFSNIIEDMQLYISKVKHKTFIEVNEKGTEAAAVTSVEIGYTSIDPSSQFIANRPFLFVIREKYTNSILFMGRVEDPSKE
ncbi:MAG: serpin family protein [Bacteroidales bacterium]|nr:serpin family protein [Bacteroidales bacterium]